MKITSSWEVGHCVVSFKYTDISKVFTASIVIGLMMKAVRISEMLVYFNETMCCFIPEDCHLHIHHCENLKSRIIPCIFFTLQLHMYVIKLNPVFGYLLYDFSFSLIFCMCGCFLIQFVSRRC
jgi:sorbitol-specific phosphotransferase system component IIA